MSCRFGYSSPFNNRVAFFAESSAAITILGTVSSFIGKSYGCVNMGGTVFRKVNLIHSRICCIHFRINMEFFVREHAKHIALVAVNISDNTHINIHLHILSEEVICSPIGFGSKSGYFDIGIKIKDAYWYFCKNCRARLGVFSGSCKFYNCRICFFIYCVISGKSFCQFHIIELPVVYAIKVNYRFYRLYGINIGCLKVHPINRTERNSIKGWVIGYNLDG